MARLSFRCDEELVQRVDAERGLIAREAWLRRAVEQALEEPSAPGMASRSAETLAPAERPVGPIQQAARSSRQTKDFKPYPKKKR